MPVTKKKTRASLRVPGLEFTRYGAPRWVAEPVLRQAGWQTHMLQDIYGEPLDGTAAAARARQLNAAVTLWRGGQMLDESFADVAPPSAIRHRKPAAPTRQRTRMRTPLDVPGLEYTAAGNPRWVAQPGLRQAGWKSQMLRDEGGLPLDAGAALIRAREINEAVKRWREGRIIDESFAEIAPAEATLRPATAPLARAERTIGRLVDEYLADPLPAGKPIKSTTRTNYRYNLATFVAAFARLQNVKEEQLRGHDIAVLQRPEKGKGGQIWVQLIYDELYRTKGVHVADAYRRSLACFLNWVIKKKNLLEHNPVRGLLTTEKPAGRIVVLEDIELDALVEAADWVGLVGVADAVLLSLDSTWGEQDILALTEDKIGADNTLRALRIKTGQPMAAKLMPQTLGRLAEIRARPRDPERAKGHIVLTPAGRPYGEDNFRRHFELVREIASGWPNLPRRLDEDERDGSVRCPAILLKQFRDIRDTAITNCILAKLPDRLLFQRTGHSPKSGPEMLSGHYAYVGKKAADVTEAHLLEFWAAKAKAKQAAQAKAKMLAAE